MAQLLTFSLDSREGERSAERGRRNATREAGQMHEVFLLDDGLETDNDGKITGWRCFQCGEVVGLGVQLMARKPSTKRKIKSLRKQFPQSKVFRLMELLYCGKVRRS